MVVIGAVLMFAVPFYQKHFTNFVITQQDVNLSADGIGSFDVEIDPIDSPLAISVSTTFRAVSSIGSEFAIVPIIVNGPSGDVFAESYTVSANSLVTEGLSQEFKSQTISIDPITITMSGLYTLTAGPMVDEGLAVEGLAVELRGRALPAWPNLDAISWALFGIGAFAILFGRRGRRSKPVKRSKTSSIGRRVQPTKPKEQQQPNRKWGRD